MKRFFAGLCLLAGVGASPAMIGTAAAETLLGRVSEVIDGDTLRVEVAGHGAVLVRLAWIDAPDRLQEHGEVARGSLNALAAQRMLRLETVGGGKGQLRARAWVAPQEGGCGGDDCPQTLDLGQAQLARGMAWHDRRLLGQPMQSFGDYEQSEFQAKVRRRGLWAAKNPTPPWDWRGR